MVVLLLFIKLAIIYDNEQKASIDENGLEQIMIPVKVHLVSESSGQYTSIRDEKNIERLFEQANRIWLKAGIKFVAEKSVVTIIGSDSIPTALNVTPIELHLHKNFDENKLNLFLVNQLDGVNGVAMKELNLAIVADYTTVNDFRTVAHELGHLLDLGHVSYFGRLMTSGENGEFLTEEEINISRTNALQFISN